MGGDSERTDELDSLVAQEDGVVGLRVRQRETTLAEMQRWRGTDGHREGCGANSTRTLLFTDHPPLLSRHQICVLRSPRKVSRKSTQYSRDVRQVMLKGG
jgi:hypothetical protein